jgi:hypothetical protein
LDDGGIITFTDGRHRVAWLRNHGVEALPVEVPPDQAATIQARLGTPCRESIFRLEAGLLSWSNIKDVILSESGA